VINLPALPLPTTLQPFRRRPSASGSKETSIGNIELASGNPTPFVISKNQEKVFSACRCPERRMSSTTAWELALPQANSPGLFRPRKLTASRLSKAAVARSFRLISFQFPATVLSTTIEGTENWALRDFLYARFEVIPNGDASVPEPATVVLLGTGWPV